MVWAFGAPMRPIPVTAVGIVLRRKIAKRFEHVAPAAPLREPVLGDYLELDLGSKPKHRRAPSPRVWTGTLIGKRLKRMVGPRRR